MPVSKSVAGTAEGKTKIPAFVACGAHSASIGSGTPSTWIVSFAAAASPASATACRLRRTPGTRWSSSTTAVVRAGGSLGKYSRQTSLNS